MAEDLSTYLQELDIKTHIYILDVDTMERGDILNDLRSRCMTFVGINLLRAGLSDFAGSEHGSSGRRHPEGFCRAKVHSATDDWPCCSSRRMGRCFVCGYHDALYASSNRRKRIGDVAYKRHDTTRSMVLPTSIEKAISEGLRAIIPKRRTTNKA